MKLANCPDSDILRALLLGVLDTRDHEFWVAHVGECQNCVTAAEKVRAEDHLTESLRRDLGIQTENVVVASVIDRAGHLHTELDTIRPFETASEHVNSTACIAELLNKPESEDEIGRLGGYRVLKLLDSGGMGVVFLAEDPNLQREVALKIIKPAASSNPVVKQRFLQEARAAAAIEHDHVVSVYQVGEDGDVPFIAMQLLRGESLQHRLSQQGRIEQRALLRISREIACGLDAAHQRGLIHRDIKPANIWLEEATDRVKILDFGLARSADLKVGETKFGTLVGTPKYMAPEQAEGKDCDARSDLFSLGCVMYQLATGRSPFDGGNVTKVLIQVVREEPTDVRQLAPEVDYKIADLIMRLLSKEPQRRPDSASDVIKSIEEIEAHVNRPGASTVGRSIGGKIRDMRIMLTKKKRALALAITLLVLLLGGVYLLSPKAIKHKTSDEIRSAETGNYAFNLNDDYQHLIKTADGIKVYRETSGAIYWAPEEPGRWGELVLQINFSSPIEVCEIQTHLFCAYSLDRKAKAEIAVSGDGKEWHTIVSLSDNRPEEIGENGTGGIETDYTFRDISEYVKNETTVFVRVRLFAIQVLKNQPIGDLADDQFSVLPGKQAHALTGPVAAQFLRSYDYETGNQFVLRVKEK